MGRLIKRNHKGEAYFDYKDIKFPDRYSRCYGQVADKLAYYEDLEERGLLLRLPCNAGDLVYRFGYENCEPYEVREDTFTTVTTIVLLMETGRFGKDIFLTKTEAEEALRKM